MFSGISKSIARPDTIDKMISIRAFCPGGLSNYVNDDYASAICAVNIADQSGIAGISKKTWNEYLKMKHITLAASIIDNYTVINATCEPDDLETLLQLLRLYTMSRTEKVGMVSLSASMEASFLNNPFKHHLKALTAFHTRAGFPQPASQISISKACKIFNAEFSNAANYTFVITGNLYGNVMNEPTKATPILFAYLEKLQVDTNRKHNIGPFFSEAVAGRSVSVKTNFKTSIVSGALIYSGSINYSDSTRLQLSALAEILAGKLNRVGVNNVSIDLDVRKIPTSQFVFTVNYAFSANKDNPGNKVKKLIKGLENNISENDINNFVQNKKKELRSPSNNFWPDYLKYQFQNNNDLQIISEYPYAFNRITLSSLRAACSAYLNNQNFSELTTIIHKVH